MKKFAVKNGIISNIVVADDSFVMDGYDLYPADGVKGEIGWAWVNGAPVEPVILEEKAWGSLRSQRDALLKNCDWTQVADAPVNSLAWAVYRQELRDLPANTTDPYNPVWPTKPE